MSEEEYQRVYLNESGGCYPEDCPGPQGPYRSWHTFMYLNYTPTIDDNVSDTASMEFLEDNYDTETSQVSD